MAFVKAYLSKPAVCFPEQRVDNEEVLQRIRENFRGPDSQWPNLEAMIKRVFGICNTQTRYLDFDPKARVADYAGQAAKECLALNNVAPDEIDLVLFGGIARQYFEPATAMEVAAKLGIEETHAFDVTSACVGLLEAIQVACSYLQMHDEYRTALVCTAELAGDFLCFDIQSPKELYLKGAGLTIGNAAGAVLVRREPWPDGGVLLKHIQTYTLPAHWDLCQVPIDGQFQSSSIELMRLHTKFTPRLKQSLDRLGWNPNEVDHYVFHQPSEMMIQKVLDNLGVEAQRAVYTHHLYANNASVTVAVALHQLLVERELRQRDKIIMGSAAAGFTMTIVGGEWQN